jgi:hypothetical protein
LEEALGLALLEKEPRNSAAGEKVLLLGLGILSE